jgi:hypothetical protein
MLKSTVYLYGCIWTYVAISVKIGTKDWCCDAKNDQCCSISRCDELTYPCFESTKPNNTMVLLFIQHLLKTHWLHTDQALLALCEAQGPFVAIHTLQIRQVTKGQASGNGSASTFIVKMCVFLHIQCSPGETEDATRDGLNLVRSNLSSVFFSTCNMRATITNLLWFFQDTILVPVKNTKKNTTKRIIFNHSPRIPKCPFTYPQTRPCKNLAVSPNLRNRIHGWFVMK